MSDPTEFDSFAARIREACSHVSVRKDENGPFVLALGLKGFHTLELRRAGDEYVVELWRGDAESENMIAEPSFATADAAFIAAQEWLQRDAV